MQSQKCDLLISDCTIIPMNSDGLIKNGFISVRDGKITQIGTSKPHVKVRASITVEAKGKVAMPGLINCHTHVPMTLFRGMAEDQPLDTWLKKTIWPLEANLTSNDVYNGALLGCLEMIKSGTTCFGDLYFHEDAVAKAVKDSGLRAVLAEGIIESGNKNRGEKMLRKSLDFAERHNNSVEGRIRTMLGPHASYSCGSELLMKIKEKAFQLNIGIHTHVAESRDMSKDLEKECRASEVEYLSKIGFLNERVLAAHCIDLSTKDMQIISKSRMNVAHAPVANMKLGLNAARVKELVDLGVNVGLGTDGPASNNSLDLFETMKTAALLQKHAYHDPTVLSSYELLKMATINGAKALGLEKEVGSLEVGKRADIVLIDMLKPHLKPLHNVCANLVYSARGSDVDTVIVDGKVLMEHRQVKTLNERTVMKKAEETALDLVRR